MASKASRLTDGTLMVLDPLATLLPCIGDILSVLQHIALAVAKQAFSEGMAMLDEKMDLQTVIELQ